MPQYFVGFSRKKSLFSRLIRFFTDSKVSHTYIRRIERGVNVSEDYVLEATGRGVHIRPYGVFLEHKAEVVSEYEVQHDTAALERAWRMVADRRVDDPYAWWQIIGDAYVLTVEEATGKRPPNPFSQKRAEVCSELVLMWFRRAGIVGFAALDFSTVTPEDLRQIIVMDSKQFRQTFPPSL